MVSTSSHSCVPRAIAVYILLYAAASEIPWLAEYLAQPYTVTAGTPGPTFITSAAATLQRGILLLWIPLSVFVWLRFAWARSVLALSALILAVAQCASYTEMLRQYGSASIVSEFLVLAIPTFFLVALSFCPAVRETFVEHTNAPNQTLQRGE